MATAERNVANKCDKCGAATASGSSSASSWAGQLQRAEDQLQQPQLIRQRRDVCLDAPNDLNESRSHKSGSFIRQRRQGEGGGEGDGEDEDTRREREGVR